MEEEQEVAVVDVVADEVLGVMACFMTTVGDLLRFRRSCSPISSPANISSFSALLSADNLLPRNNTDTMFRSFSASIAAATLASFDLAGCNPFAWKDPIRFIIYYSFCVFTRIPFGNIYYQPVCGRSSLSCSVRTPSPPLDLPATRALSSVLMH